MNVYFKILFIEVPNVQSYMHFLWLFLGLEQCCVDTSLTYIYTLGVNTYIIYLSLFF
jgi:hypothetical protein